MFNEHIMFQLNEAPIHLQNKFDNSTGAVMLENLFWYHDALMFDMKLCKICCLYFTESMHRSIHYYILCYTICLWMFDIWYNLHQNCTNSIAVFQGKTSSMLKTLTMQHDCRTATCTQLTQKWHYLMVIKF